MFILFNVLRILDGYNLNNLLKLKSKIIIGITSHYNIGGIKKIQVPL